MARTRPNLSDWKEVSRLVLGMALGRDRTHDDWPDPEGAASSDGPKSEDELEESVRNAIRFRNDRLATHTCGDLKERALASHHTGHI